MTPSPWAHSPTASAACGLCHQQSADAEKSAVPLEESFACLDHTEWPFLKALASVANP